MSFQIINGREVEILEDIHPHYESSYKPYKTLFVDTSGNIHIKIEEIRKTPINMKPHLVKKKYSSENISILGKRKLEDAFGYGSHDTERYGQEISPDFFKTNYGHSVKVETIKPKGASLKTTENLPPLCKEKEAEIIEWCYKYMASKNKGYFV